MGRLKPLLPGPRHQRAEQDERVRHHWRAGHLAAHSLCGEGDARALMLLTREWTQRTFEQWLTKTRPDAIVTIGSKVLEWLGALQLRVPQDVGVANIDLAPDMSTFDASIYPI